MYAFAELFRSPLRSRLSLLAVIAAAVSGCSSEASRFNDTPFSNPFSSRGEVTGSVSQQQSAPPPRIESRPLAQAQAHPQTNYQTAALTPPPAQVRSGPPYRPVSPDVTGSAATTRTVAPLARGPRAVPASNGGRWEWEGGSAITVGRGDTLETLGHRYGVPASAIAQANGLTANTPVYPGQRMVIPRYTYASAPAAPASAAPASVGSVAATMPARVAAPTPVAAAASRPSTPAQAPQVHVVGPGENLTMIARRYRKPLTEVAAANNIPPYKMVRMGDRLTIPGARTTAPASITAAKPQPAASTGQQPASRMASNQPTSTAHVAKPTADITDDDKDSDATGANAGFRWPVRGRIITAFGPKPTGQQNDGINLAVPEGTPVKAAEEGTVAYAGNELKGYGNLVLVRHSNGYVTAYAHASELMVKRGDKIKRGQVIAKSGQTGNVSSPQLHFEIRKGSTPVDPMQHLTGAT